MSPLTVFTVMLASLASRLSAFAETVRGMPAVRSVTSSVEPRVYASGPRIEAYVDAELESGNAVAWWLEFREEAGSWVIESDVLHTTSEGQDSIRELPDRYAVEADELAEELDGATRVLLDCLRLEDVRHL